MNAERRKVTYDVRVRKPEFGIGNWVWYYYPRRYVLRSKWQRYTGTYLIACAIQPVNFVLQKTQKSKPFAVLTDKFKKCHNPTTMSWLTFDDATDGRELTAEGVLTYDQSRPDDQPSDHAQHTRTRAIGTESRTEYDIGEASKAHDHVGERVKICDAEP